MHRLQKGVQRLLRQIPLILAVLVTASSCGESPSSAPRVRTFPKVSIPSVLQGDEALSYAAVHYWDAFLDTTGKWLSDSLHLAGVDMESVEQQVGTYSTILGMIPLDDARESMGALFSRMEECADSLTFEGLSSLVCRYMYDPNSPVRNEDIYSPFADGLAHSPRVPKERRRGYQWEVSMSSLNRVGTPAADFSFTDIRGRRHTLYGVKAPLTLLFFSNPGCPNCREIMGALTMEEVSSLVGQGILAVVNVYIDEDLQAWRDYEHNYPRGWLTGYDQDCLIRNDVLYNVRAIPSLYLLDSEKTVLLKDAPLEKVMQAIASFVGE